MLYPLSESVQESWLAKSRMLKIGSVKWRGKCVRHPGFDPAIDGIGAIRGNCQKCTDLAQIYALHQQALRLMRQFPALQPKQKLSTIDDDSQQDLFA